jgi:hypothetical protein
MPALRFRVDPRDVPADKAARRLHLTAAEFAVALPALVDRGFPPPDPTTGMFDLKAIDEWMDGRHRLTLSADPRDVQKVIRERLARL